MKRIPQDIDQLMWTLAEAGDPRAVEDFEQRFPEHKYELAKRILVVRNLRLAAKGGTHAAAVPRFELRPQAQVRWARSAWAAGALAVLAVAAIASYSLTKRVMGSGGDGPAGPEIVRNPRPTPQDSVPESRPAPTDTTPQVKESDLPPAPYQEKLTIKIDRIALHAAIQHVAAQAHLEVTIAPGLEDPDVAMDYSEMSGLAILEDMGKQLGFTPFYESKGSVLIIPAVDPKKLNEPSTANGTTHVIDKPGAPKTTDMKPAAPKIPDVKPGKPKGGGAPVSGPMTAR